MARKAGPRHEARKRALEILYEADLKDRAIATVLAEHLAAGQPPEFTLTLVRGVNRHRDELDSAISQHARDWKISRMPLVDRNILRLGAYEILHEADIPAAVAIDEAIELAKELSTDESPRFVNGVLGRIANADAPSTP